MSAEREFDEATDALLETIFERYHYDFREYARASLRRRVGAAVRHFGCSTVATLEERLKADAELFKELLDFLTIRVTEFFRDPEYYKALRDEVVPYLKTYSSLRLWVAGCATGEEAYSLAILLEEEGLLERSLVYATDINPGSLRIAQEGIFSADVFAKSSANYQAAGGKKSLSNHYFASANSVMLDKALKSKILFSDHSLATDTPFAEMQFISCRNVLIYFDRKLQERAIGVFHQSLCHKGFLGLGTRETLRFSHHAHLFREFVPGQKLYRRN